MIDVCYFADEVSKTDFEEAIKLGVEAGQIPSKSEEGFGENT